METEGIAGKNVYLAVPSAENDYQARIFEALIGYVLDSGASMVYLPAARLVGATTGEIVDEAFDDFEAMLKSDLAVVMPGAEWEGDIAASVGVPVISLAELLAL